MSYTRVRVPGSVSAIVADRTTANDTRSLRIAMIEAFVQWWEAFRSIPHLAAWIGGLWAAYILVLVVWIVWEKREPVATLSWLLSLAALPVLGYAIYFLLGPRRIRRQQLRRLRSRALLAEDPSVFETDERHTQLARLALRITGLPPMRARHPVLLEDGENAYAAMLAAIAQATHHIHLATYIYDADVTGKMFREALVERAKAGVKVRVLIDSVGSAGLKDSFFRELTKAGGEIAWFHPIRLRFMRLPAFNHRSHRKILVVDGTTAFTGGINITDTQDARRRADAFRDIHLRIEGHAVRGLQVVFLEDWAYATTIALRDARLWPRPDGRGALALVVPSGPDSDWQAIHRLQLELIHCATERVYLITPYFVPTPAARLALTNAALRGVDVRVLVPERSDSRIVSAAARSYFDELLAAGVKVHEYLPSMLHTKALLVDADQVFVGSANFDNRSFQVNFELSVQIRDLALAEQLCRVYEGYEADARQVREDAAAPWPQRLLDAFARLLSPLL